MKVPAPASYTLAVDDLRPGMFVQLDLGWLQHPFARNRFKLESHQQIDRLRLLGLQKVQVWPGLSDLQAFEATTVVADDAVDPPVTTNSTPVPTGTGLDTDTGPTADAQRLRQQQRSYERTERAQAQATRHWQALMRDVLGDPRGALAQARSLGRELVQEMSSDGDVALRLITEAAGTAASQHAVNVSVLSLMLARRLQLSGEALEAVAVGALLHDIGKLALPEPLRSDLPAGGPLVQRERLEHVAQGVRLGMAMGLDATALKVIAQHHELHDGSGLPRGLSGDAIALPARVVALVNVYDRLCNPRDGQAARTPHEAQAWLYAQRREHFDPAVMGAFIKLMGVYPPGSIVELADGRTALVVAVNGEQALKPDVLVYNPRVPRDEALLLSLNTPDAPRIRRSMTASHLPRAVLDYFATRERVVCYFAHDLHGALADHAH